MFTIEDMIGILKSHRSKVKAMRQLEFELTQIGSLLTEEDVIYSLSLSAPAGEAVSTGRISDRTCDAALSYTDEAMDARRELISALHRELTALQLEVHRLEHYVSLLEDEPAQIIRSLFFESKTLEKMSEVLDITPKTLASRRQNAIKLLVEMYRRLEDIYNNNL